MSSHAATISLGKDIDKPTTRQSTASKVDSRLTDHHKAA